jgi:hypothetical protein
MLFGIDMDGGRAEQQDLRGIINPKEDDDKGTGSAVSGTETAAPEVGAQQIFARGKKQGGDERANPDIAPGDLNIGQHLKNHGKQQGDDAQGDDDIQNVPDDFMGRDHSAHPFTRRFEGGADNKGDEQ